MQWQRHSFCCGGVTESRWQWVFGGVDLNTGDFFHGNLRQTRRRYAYASHPQKHSAGHMYLEWWVAGPPAVAAAWLLNSPTLPTTLPLMASVSTGLRLYSSLSRVNKHYFFTSMTMRLWITVSASSTWRLVSTRKWYHTGPLVGVQGNLEAPIRSDVPTSAVVRRWVHMAKKSTWRGMHVCSVFGYLAHHQVEIRK